MTLPPKDELFALIDGLRDRGVQYFECGELKVAIATNMKPDLSPFLTMPEEADDSEVDEDLLYHSAPRPQPGT